MQMQNLSHNSGSQSSSGSQDDDKQDKARKMNDLQREITMVESDFRKVNGEKNNLEMEIRALKKDEDHIRMELQNKRTQLGKVEFQLLQLDTNIKNLKKKINLL
jgi:chromosome segregation ATPase